MSGLEAAALAIVTVLLAMAALPHRVPPPIQPGLPHRKPAQPAPSDREIALEASQDVLCIERMLASPQWCEFVLQDVGGGDE